MERLRQRADFLAVATGVKAPAGAFVLQALKRGRLPAIVETEAVDHGLVLDQPEQPRLGISGLRTRGERADFDEAEAERKHLFCNLGILVETGRKPDRRGKAKTGDTGRQRRVERTGAADRRGLQRGDGGVMGALRIQRESQRPQITVKPHRKRW